MKNEAKLEMGQDVREQGSEEMRLKCVVFGSVRSEWAGAFLFLFNY